MKPSHLWYSLFLLVVGCGGSSYKIASSVTADSVVLSTEVVPVGEQDGLGAISVAMSGAGCQVVKARYTLGPGELVGATCNNIAMTFGQMKGGNRIMATCPAATGVPACEAQFNKVLNMAHDAHYIR